ncbi:MAG: fumarylacetoacetate hydrolase family protein [Burkholderiaceae bacterium]|jgi:fumarylpyruvate hydrolase|nr:fumarylacetoacetate hydrolase family protein [Burkholderiaceae bacterium]
MGYAFAAPAQAVVPIDGTTDLYPVHRIYCVGRNYADHAKEMGFSGREAPFFFMKPADAVLPVPWGATGEMPYPGETTNLHHEIELVVAIGRAGRDIAPEAAAAHLWGYAVGLDMTRRDLQFALRDKGRPWDVAKGFDCSAPISPLKPIAATGEITAGAIWLEVNGAKRQSSDIDKLIWNVNETVSHLSKYYTLAPGDLIYTGTPEGVGAVVRGDLLVGGVAGLGTLQVRIV